MGVKGRPLTFLIMKTTSTPIYRTLNFALILNDFSALEINTTPRPASGINPLN
jgi:hypothetical protein